MQKEMSNQDYQKALVLAKENEPKIITTTLKNIIIEGESFDKNYIVLVMREGNFRLTVSEAFFKQLAKILNINLSIRKTLTEDNNVNTIYSELLNAMRGVQNLVKPMDVTLLFNPIEKKITHIKKGTFSRMSNETLFTFAESLVTKYPHLVISNVNTNPYSSDVAIQILSGNIVDLTDVAISEENESFQFGITIGNHGLVTSVGDFAYRLVCTNGMMGIRTDERFYLPNTQQDGLLKLFEHFEKMKEQNFVPEDFAANYQNAAKVHASYAELKKSHDFAQKHLVVEFPEQEGQLRKAFSDTFFHDVAIIQEKLKRKGINENEIPDKAMQLIRTQTKMWDLINTMTYLGSNEHHVYHLNNKPSFQRLGGKILSDDWDLEFEQYLLL